MHKDVYAEFNLAVITKLTIYTSFAGGYLRLSLTPETTSLILNTWRCSYMNSSCLLLQVFACSIYSCIREALLCLFYTRVETTNETQW